MRVLVTAGNTQTPIDRVRCITNTFTGRTGAAIAIEARNRHEHEVTLLTSHPEAVADMQTEPSQPPKGLRLIAYRTFEELSDLMSRELGKETYDAVIHSAAVSDYLPAGVFTPAKGSSFSQEKGTWIGDPPALLDRAAEKIRSDETELWLRLVRAPKLVDKVRSEWGFRGVLVKFKLEVGVSEQELLTTGENSRIESQADLMVANTLEGMHTWAYLGPLQSGYERIGRRELPARLLDAVVRKHKERTNG